MYLFLQKTGRVILNKTEPVFLGFLFFLYVFELSKVILTIGDMAPLTQAALIDVSICLREQRTSQFGCTHASSIGVH